MFKHIGLYDKNGRVIYEGDTLKITNPECQVQKMELSGVVVYRPDYAAYGVSVKEVLLWEGYNVPAIEVGGILWFLNLVGSKILTKLEGVWKV